MPNMAYHEVVLLPHRGGKTSNSVRKLLVARRGQKFRVPIPNSEQNRRPDIPHFTVIFGHSEPEPWLTCLKKREEQEEHVRLFDKFWKNKRARPDMTRSKSDFCHTEAGEHSHILGQF
jgi:hypothetical protein